MASARIACCLLLRTRRATGGSTGARAFRSITGNFSAPSSFLLERQLLFHHHCSSTASPEEQGNMVNKTADGHLTHEETRKLLYLVQVEHFKTQLRNIGKDCIWVSDLIKLCQEGGTAISYTQAQELARSLDQAGVILIFREKAFLNPERVARLLSSSMPFPLAEEGDPRKEELDRLLKEKEEIDRIALMQVRRMLWAALGGFSLQSLLFFRLTFWDLSWDVMEPVTFFATSGSILAGFLFFVCTHRDPSYQDLRHTILLSKQRKLMKKRNFNSERLKELQMQFSFSDKTYGISHAT